MAFQKWKFTTPRSGGDIAPDITESKIQNLRIRRGRLRVTIHHGTTIDGEFVPSPITPGDIQFSDAWKARANCRRGRNRTKTCSTNENAQPQREGN